jgi:cell wall-associated NlpC family hydrolase
MSLIRTTLLLAIVALVASCGTLKPAAKLLTNNTLAAGQKNYNTNQPHFLDVKEITAPKFTTAHSSKTSVNAFTNLKLDENSKDAATTPAKSYSSLQLKYSLILDVPADYINNLELYNSIEEWYGTRYRFGGTTKRGVDCSSLMQHLYTSAYFKDIPRTAITQYRATTRVSQEDLQEGDLVFFHTTRSGISHVGLYLGNRRFVHASSSHGVTISNLDEKYYVNAYRGAGRFAEDYVFTN